MNTGNLLRAGEHPCSMPISGACTLASWVYIGFVSPPGLEYYTVYSIRVQACTAVGCALSLASSVRTLEAAPADMDRPMLNAQATASGAHSAILVTWDAPRKLNGLLKEYRLERRQVLSLSSLGKCKSVYGRYWPFYNLITIIYFRFHLMGMQYPSW